MHKIRTSVRLTIVSILSKGARVHHDWLYSRGQILASASRSLCHRRNELARSYLALTLVQKVLVSSLFFFFFRLSCLHICTYVRSIQSLPSICGPPLLGWTIITQSKGLYFSCVCCQACRSLSLLESPPSSPFFLFPLVV